MQILIKQSIKLVQTMIVQYLVNVYLANADKMTI